MGIKRTPWKIVKGHLPNAVTTTPPVFCPELKHGISTESSNGIAVYEDPLCFLMRCKLNGGTPLDLYEAFMKPVRERICCNPHIVKYVIALDQQKFMPHRKKRVQEKRNSKLDMRDYKTRKLETIRIDDRGIYEDGKLVNFGKVRIAFFCARHLRPAFYNYMLGKLEQEIKTMENLEMIVIFDPRGSWHLSCDRNAWLDSEPIRVGEADPLVWGLLDLTQINWIISQDSDHLWLLMNAWMKHKPKHPIILSGSGGNHMVVRGAAPSSLFRLQALLLLCGTDYVDPQFPKRTLTTKIASGIQSLTRKSLFHPETFTQMYDEISDGQTDHAQETFKDFMWNWTYWDSCGTQT
jgi:hypothetical protein